MATQRPPALFPLELGCSGAVQQHLTKEGSHWTAKNETKTYLVVIFYSCDTVFVYSARAIGVFLTAFH